MCPLKSLAGDSSGEGEAISCKDAHNDVGNKCNNRILDAIKTNTANSNCAGAGAGAGVSLRRGTVDLSHRFNLPKVDTTSFSSSPMPSGIGITPIAGGASTKAEECGTVANATQTKVGSAKHQCKIARKNCEGSCKKEIEEKEGDIEKLDSSDPDEKEKIAKLEEEIEGLKSVIEDCEEKGVGFFTKAGEISASLLQTSTQLAGLALMAAQLYKMVSNPDDCEKKGGEWRNGQCGPKDPEDDPDEKPNTPKTLELGDIKQDKGPIFPGRNRNSGEGGGGENNNDTEGNTKPTGTRPPAISFPNASDTANNGGSQNSQIGSVGQIASGGGSGGAGFNSNFDDNEDEDDDDNDKENKYKPEKMDYSSGGGGGRSYASTTKQGRKNILSKMGIKVKENTKKDTSVKRLSKLDASDNIFERITNRFHYVCQTKIDCYE